MWKADFENPNELINYVTENFPEQLEKYNQAKEELNQQNYPGISQLLKSLNNQKQITDYLSFLAEFNVALHLHRHRVPFEYEPRIKNGNKQSKEYNEDFVFNDIALSVKSLHENELTKEENKMLENLRQNPKPSNKVVIYDDDKLEVPTPSFVEHVIHKDDMHERTEIGNDGLYTRTNQLNPILAGIAKLHSKTVEPQQLKAILFIRQTAVSTSSIIKDASIWYFKGKHPRQDKTPYDKMFRVGKIQAVRTKPNGNMVSVILTMERSNLPLVWEEDDFSSEKIVVYSRDTKSKKKIDVHFKRCYDIAT